MNAAFLASLTSCSLWKTTTLPPLSPVANSSPDELNSTVEIMSAATQGSRAERRWGGGKGGGNVSAWTRTTQKNNKKKAVKVSVRQKGGRRVGGTWEKTWPVNFKVRLGNRKWNLSLRGLSLSDTDAPVWYKYGLGEITGWLTAWYRAIQPRLIEASQSGSLNCAPAFFSFFFFLSFLDS